MADRVPDLPRGVAILGAGAIGSLIAARVLMRRVPVTLVGRPEDMRAVRERGLIYHRPRWRSVVLRDLDAVSNWGELERTEIANIGLVILTTRVQDKIGRAHV